MVGSLSRLRSSSNSRKQSHRAGSFLLRVVVSGGLLALLAWSVDLSALAGTFAKCSAQWWASALGVYVLAQTASTIRWKVLANTVGLHVSFGRLWLWYLQGSFFSLCLPTSLGGDVYKVMALGQRTRQTALAACSVVADRLCGLVAMVALVAASLAGQMLQVSIWWMLLLVPVCLATEVLVICSIFLVGSRASSHAGNWLLRWPGVAQVFVRLTPFRRRPEVLVATCAWAFAVQGLNVVAVALLGIGLGIEGSAYVYLTAVPLATLLSVLPLSLGGLGVREGGLAAVLAAYGIATATGLMLGVLWFSVLLTAGLLGGLLYAVAPVRAQTEGVPGERSATVGKPTSPPTLDQQPIHRQPAPQPEPLRQAG